MNILNNNNMKQEKEIEFWKKVYRELKKKVEKDNKIDILDTSIRQRHTYHNYMPNFIEFDNSVYQINFIDLIDVMLTEFELDENNFEMCAALVLTKEYIQSQLVDINLDDIIDII